MIDSYISVQSRPEMDEFNRELTKLSSQDLIKNLQSCSKDSELQLHI